MRSRRSPKCTVLPGSPDSQCPISRSSIPTHDHSDTLPYAVRSVLWQSREDFELFIVGDGVPDRTREIARQLMAEDSRISFFDFPKGERHGEAYRHQVLESANGRFVCYQSDDDLWFPEYLETMAELLESHDLAHCMQVDVMPEGTVMSWMFDAMVDPLALSRMQASKDGFGLNSGGHRLDAYRRLPRGWHPAPRGINTDVYFWLQFLREPWCRYVSHKWPGVVHLSSATRRDWSLARRTEELASWWERIQPAPERERLARECLLPLHDKLLAESVTGSSRSELAGEIERLTAALRASRNPESRLPSYVPGTRLTFSAGGNAACHPLSGFAAAEAWGRWTLGTASNVVLCLEQPVTTDLTLELELLPFLHETLRLTCEFSVLLNGRAVLRAHECRHGIHRYAASVPRVLCGAASVLVVTIECPSAVRPTDLGISADDRMLGVGLVSLTVAPAAADGSV